MSALPAPTPLRPAPSPQDEMDVALFDALGPHRTHERRTDALATVLPFPEVARAGDEPSRPPFRRIMVMLAIVAVLGLLVGAVNTLGGPAEAGPVDGVRDVVVLEPGQSLWDLAADATPAGGDVRATLSEIRELNEFSGSSVEPWTPVVVPAG